MLVVPESREHPLSNSNHYASMRGVRGARSVCYWNIISWWEKLAQLRSGFGIYSLTRNHELGCSNGRQLVSFVQ